jgi:hypothetical protein
MNAAPQRCDEYEIIFESLGGSEVYLYLCTDIRSAVEACMKMGDKHR